MIWTPLLAPTAMILLLACPPLAAQEDPPPGETAPQEQGPDSASDGLEQEDASAGQAPPDDDSPFDYEASEQISEDLSVSFPVDI